MSVLVGQNKEALTVAQRRRLTKRVRQGKLFVGDDGTIRRVGGKGKAR